MSPSTGSELSAGKRATLFTAAAVMVAVYAVLTCPALSVAAEARDLLGGVALSLGLLCLAVLIEDALPSPSAYRKLTARLGF